MNSTTDYFPMQPLFAVAARKNAHVKASHALTASAVALVAGLLLSGCTTLTPQADKPAASTSPHTPIATPSDSPGERESDVTTPGSIVTLGEWATYEYRGTEKLTAVLAARLVSVEKATPAQNAFLVSQISELAGYTVWILTVEQKKISGDPIVYGTDYTAFEPIDADKKRVQGVTIIGWTECASQSFTPEFDEAGATITQCIIGATKTGDDVAGLRYAEPKTRYDPYDGNPIIFVK